MFYKEIFELKGYKNSEEVNAFKGATADIEGQVTLRDRKEKLRLFSKYLKDRGFKPLGSGSFGATFTHPSIDYCIKVFKNDPAYIHFVEWAMSRAKNPHVPKFRGKLMSIDNTYSAVRMEILNEDFSEQEEFAVSMFSRYASAGSQDKQAIRNHIRRVIADKTDTEEYQVVIDQARVMTTIDELEDLNNGQFVFDLHGGNFMRRDNGTIVIIDPFADDSQYKR